MGDRYFVRARPDAPEKGPYDLESIRKSHENKMLKDDAVVRHEDLTETHTLRELLGLAPPAATPREKQHAQNLAEHHRVALEEDERAYQQRQAAGSSNVMIGVIMIVAGLGLTAISFSASGGGGVLFIGLVVFGFLRILRG